MYPIWKIGRLEDWKIGRLCLPACSLQLPLPGLSYHVCHLAQFLSGWYVSSLRSMHGSVCGQAARYKMKLLCISLRKFKRAEVAVT